MANVIYSFGHRMHNVTHTHTHLTALCPALPRSADTRKVKSIWILLKKEIVSCLQCFDTVGWAAGRASGL